MFTNSTGRPDGKWQLAGNLSGGNYPCCHEIVSRVILNVASSQFRVSRTISLIALESSTKRNRFEQCDDMTMLVKQP